MSGTCVHGTSGGRGNRGMFIERDTNVCAAGVTSGQPYFRIADCFKQYSMQDEVDSLIGDSIRPPPKQTSLPPLRRQPKRDMRYAGPFSETAELINPPNKTKFQTLVEDFKTTSYTSYWKKMHGTIPDPIPMLPEGLDYRNTMFGKKTPFLGRLYDIVMPNDAAPDKTPDKKRPGYQTNRGYIKPAFNPNIVFGMKSKKNVPMKCCMADDRVTIGTSSYSPVSSSQADYQINRPRLGVVPTPNNNINAVPPGFAFGKLLPLDDASVPQCFTNCQLDAERTFFLKCLSHLNTIRKCLSKRFDVPFFAKFYKNLKYMDQCRTGWLPKEDIYNYCTTKFIRFNPIFIEALLKLWNACDGVQIEYKTLVHVLNFKEPLPELPKIRDVGEECIDFRTTYTEMVKPNQESDPRLLAGLPSGRYFDMDYPVTPLGCCKADTSYLPHESDAKSCLCPSIFTLFGVSHREMYARRTPEKVRKVFEGAGEKFTDTKFDAVWKAAKKYHFKGWVSYETFRKALNDTTVNDENMTSN